MIAWLLWGCAKRPDAAWLPSAPDEDVAASVVEADAVDILTAGTTSDEPDARARSHALLVTHQGASPWGRAAAEDESAWVRTAVVEALGRRGDPESRGLLEAVAEDRSADPYLRGLAARRAPGARSAQAMSEALSVEREAWRRAPLALAALRLGVDGAQEALTEAVARGELDLDLGFVKELGATAEPALLSALAEAQERVEDELLLPIAAARVLLGDESAAQALRRAVADDDVERRLEALDFVAELDDADAFPLLRRAREAGPEIVTAYADLVLASRSAADPGVFSAAYADPDREIRALAVKYAATALQRPERRAKPAMDVVLAAFDDPDAAVRAEACRAAATLALGTIEGSGPRDPSLGSLVLARLSDDVPAVRIEAAGAALALR